MRAISICPDPAHRSTLEQALSEYSNLNLCRSFQVFPDADTLARAVRAWAPSIVFLDITHLAAEKVNSQLAAEFPSVRRVALHPSQSPDVFRRVLHLGMAELLNPPFRPAQVRPVLERLLAGLNQAPAEFPSNCRISAFLPAKAGVGASTVAAHATWAAAENPEARVLLMDFDRHSGITAFQFNTEPDYTITDALQAAPDLDEDSWRSLVKSRGNIDLLLSRPGELIDTQLDAHVPPLMHFAQRNYTTIHADLPDSLDSQTLTVLHQADQIFIVTTPELPSLRLARVKAAALQRLELEGRTRLVLNRMNHRLGLSKAEIEEAVGMPVHATLSCDYDGISQSLRKARPSERLVEEAQQLLRPGNLPSKSPIRRWRFLERITTPWGAHQIHPRADVSIMR